MIFLDTNVLIYAADPGSRFHSWAREVITHHVATEGAMINPVILAELCVGEAHPERAATAIRSWGVDIVDLPFACAERCARAYAAYGTQRRKETGSTAPVVPLPDFFIGAHASLLNIALATADIGRYRTYFPELKLHTPG